MKNRGPRGKPVWDHYLIRQLPSRLYQKSTQNLPKSQSYEENLLCSLDSSLLSQPGRVGPWGWSHGGRPGSEFWTPRFPKSPHLREAHPPSTLAEEGHLPSQEPPPRLHLRLLILTASRPVNSIGAQHTQNSELSPHSQGESVHSEGRGGWCELAEPTGSLERTGSPVCWTGMGVQDVRSAGGGGRHWEDSLVTLHSAPWAILAGRWGSARSLVGDGRR